MKDEFEELLDAVKRCRRYCPVVKEDTTEKHAIEIKKEAEEVLKAIEKGDNKNLQEELGDVFWDLLMTIIIAEQEGKVNSNKVIEEVIDKFKRRKPFIFKGKTTTKEKAWEMWNKEKDKEKKWIK